MKSKGRLAQGQAMDVGAIFRNWNDLRIGRWLEWLSPYRLPLAILVHVAILTAAYLLSFYLRFEGVIPDVYYHTMVRTLPLVLLVQGFFFHYHDLYRGLWCYVSFTDILNLLRATLMSLPVLIILDFFLAPYLGQIPRSIYIMDFLWVVALTSGGRFLARHLREHTFCKVGKPNPRRIMVVGPVKVAESLIREMLSNPNGYLPVALVDPKVNFHGYRLHGIRITGGLNQIIPTLHRYCIQEIIFAFPEAPKSLLNDLIKECRRSEVELKIVPSFSEVLNGHYRLADVRDIDVEDLLPRPPVHIEWDQIVEFIQGRTILVTGAGGSIGSELCRQLARFKPRALVLLERAENSLLEIGMSLKHLFPDLDFQTVVASINDLPGLNILFRQYRPDLVFHAAAYKHVPLMEQAPIEAAYNNILGTRNLVKAALAVGTERFVMISTDKAVNPTSVMGVSKRIVEKYVQAINNCNSTRFLITRFGNVLGSAGSVVRLFKQQIAQGGPLTVTHPDIERFFMTIPESVQLVLQAAYMGQGGDIFVLNMGRSVKIRELAEKLILLAGKNLGTDIEIIYTGLRPGEKLYEELFNRDEQSFPTDHPLILRALATQPEAEVWENYLEEIAALVHQQDAPGLIAKFKAIIPNYVPASHQ
ncbi:MAG: polysaccharide biosynthesis protein [Deltaproteobacteria bacterium]|nr:polysaccharide biosynthesis protein [Deltaproteobacteria bacterium]MBW1952470.1 polysaccharide biosynthesis protein [Deltaproteobacteria bacterium]MBW1987399.1 polysaccharide biosynthesis protein [Deltaproteobacteria bacterium]MBW2135182.1 polysaccharide biosynthesis protein [Deltaproteobacteria bacterium]